MAIYYIGIAKQNNGKTAVIQARRSVDFLSCEICDYYGARVTTKAKLNANKANILDILKTDKPNVYNDCKYIVVD